MANVIVRIPTPLRSYTGGAEQVSVSGGTVGEVLQALNEIHAGIGERLLEANGQLRNFVNLFVNSHNVRTLDGLNTPVADGDILAIVPAVAGGKLL